MSRAFPLSALKPSCIFLLSYELPPFDVLNRCLAKEQVMTRSAGPIRSPLGSHYLKTLLSEKSMLSCNEYFISSIVKFRCNH